MREERRDSRIKKLNSFRVVLNYRWLGFPGRTIGCHDLRVHLLLGGGTNFQAEFMGTVCPGAGLRDGLSNNQLNRV